MAIKKLRNKIQGHDLNMDPGAIASTNNDPPQPRTPNSYAVENIRLHAEKRQAREAREKAEHALTLHNLHKTIGRMSLISENLQDPHGIESIVEIIKPLSRRKQHLVRLGRFAYTRWANPKATFDLGEYGSNGPHMPSKSSDEVAIQFRKERAARAWVLPFVRQGDVVSRRRPLTPSRDRPNDLIIEIPERGDRSVRSYMGGIEKFDGRPPAGQHRAPRTIGTGPDGKGTFFSPSGFKGAATGYHGDRTLDSILAVGHPDNIDNQVWKAEGIHNRLFCIQDDILNRIAAENGVNPVRDIPRPPDLPPPAY